MTLEQRFEALAATVAQQQATIAQVQVVIADMQAAACPGGIGWSLRVKEGKVSLGDAGVFGGVVTAAPNQAAEEVVNEITEQIKTSKLFSQLS